MLLPVFIYFIFFAFAGASAAPKKEETKAVKELESSDPVYLGFKVFFYAMGCEALLGKKPLNKEISNLLSDAEIFNALSIVPDEAITFLVEELKTLFNRRKNIYFKAKTEELKIEKDNEEQATEKDDKELPTKKDDKAPATKKDDVVELLRTYIEVVKELEYGEYDEKLKRIVKLYLPHLFAAIDAFTKALDKANKQSSYRFHYLVPVEVLCGDLLWVLHRYTEKLLEIFGKKKTDSAFFEQFGAEKDNVKVKFDKRIESIKKVKNAITADSLRDPAKI
jgi:hypothetical protein